MRALAGLSDAALMPLVLATNIAGPLVRLAPRFWSWFGDVVAVEVARRPELRQRLNLGVAADIEEPGFPLEDISTEELEHAGVLLLAIGSADPALEAALQEVAEGVLLILRDRLAEPAAVH